MKSTIRENGMGRPKKSVDENPPTASVKIRRQLAMRSKLIAADLGIDVSDFLSDILQPAIDREWGKLIRKKGQETGDE